MDDFTLKSPGIFTYRGSSYSKELVYRKGVWSRWETDVPLDGADWIKIYDTELIDKIEGLYQLYLIQTSRDNKINEILN